MVKRDPIVRQVPCWQDPQEYLDQMVASSEIAEAQRDDVVLIQHAEGSAKANEMSFSPDICPDCLPPQPSLCMQPNQAPCQSSHGHGHDNATALLITHVRLGTGALNFLTKF